jgi:putative transposase
MFWKACSPRRFFAERKAMIDHGHNLPLAQQSKALVVGQSAVYYKPRAVPVEDLKIMRRLDEPNID